MHSDTTGSDSGDSGDSRGRQGLPEKELFLLLLVGIVLLMALTGFVLIVN